VRVRESFMARVWRGRKGEADREDLGAVGRRTGRRRGAAGWRHWRGEESSRKECARRAEASRQERERERCSEPEEREQSVTRGQWVYMARDWLQLEGLYEGAAGTPSTEVTMTRAWTVLDMNALVVCERFVGASIAMVRVFAAIMGCAMQ